MSALPPIVWARPSVRWPCASSGLEDNGCAVPRAMQWLQLAVTVRARGTAWHTAAHRAGASSFTVYIIYTKFLILGSYAYVCIVQCARKFLRRCMAVAGGDRDIDLYHWSTPRFSSVWQDTLSVLVQ